MLLALIILSLLPIHIWNGVTAATVTTNTTDAPTELKPTTTSIETTVGLQHTTFRTESTSRPACGTSGNVCRRGYDGPQGPQGLPGVQGIQGPRGTPGIEGCRGAPGRVGSPGMSGYPGLDGTPGVQGPVGLKGDKGEPGTCNCEVEIAPPPKEHAASYAAQTTGPLIAQLQTGRKSAFSVARVTPIFPNPARNNTAITFDVIYTNLGNDFDIETGRYTCPLNGTYYFNVHVYKHKVVKKPSVRLYKNEEYIMVIDDFAPPNTHDSTATTVLLSLVKGDRVWLDLNRKIKMHHNLWRRTIFSGFLLFPAEANVNP